MVNRFGEPESLKDFSIKMQLLNASGYRAIFEAAGHKLNETGGVMLWKLNAAFPSVIWQIYDWYLEPNAGYYFMQNACEPVHIQMNYDDSSIAVVNRSFFAKTRLHCSVELFTLQGESVFKNTNLLDIDATSVKEVLNLRQELIGKTGIYFLVLNIVGANGSSVSHNVYWLSPGNDFRALKNMPWTKLAVKLINSEAITSKDNKWIYEISNPTKQVAFFY